MKLFQLHAPWQLVSYLSPREYPSTQLQRGGAHLQFFSFAASHRVGKAAKPGFFWGREGRRTTKAP